jgi:hypothetical protein
MHCHYHHAIFHNSVLPTLQHIHVHHSNQAMEYVEVRMISHFFTVLEYLHLQSTALLLATSHQRNSPARALAKISAIAACVAALG